MIEVLEPGLLTTVQDLGRYGHQRYGFSPAGAADPAALILGNRLVGNDPGAAALEITLLGPVLRFTQPAVIAVTGADLGAMLGETPVPVGTVVAAAAGEILRFRGGASGCRAYLCVAGGIDVPPVLGSRSTDLLGRVGGVEGRPLRAGDRLPVGAAHAAAVPGRRLRWTFVAEDPVELRVVLGPQRDHFPDETVEVLASGTYEVLPSSDRTGVRLRGPALARAREEVLSEGQALGAVQVPPDGQPIVLLAGRATVGGYPKLGVVVTPDVARLAQARPGDRVRFRIVTPEEALRIYRDWWSRLHGDEVLAAPGEPDRPIAPADPAPSGAAGGPAQPVAPGERAGAAEGAGRAIVRAPFAGIFYDRPNPQARPYVRPGDRVEAGATVGLIEIMKSFYEVTAERAGMVRAVLVENEQPVEAGQPLLELVGGVAAGEAAEDVEGSTRSSP